VPRTVVLRIDDLDVEVTVRRVKRMNVRVHPPHGAVRVSVPPRTSDRAVVRFVRECRAWIEHHRARIAEDAAASHRSPAPPPPSGASGELWSRFGQVLRLEVVERAGSARVLLRPGRRLVVLAPDPGDGPALLRVLDRWQREELRRAAGAMMPFWSAQLGVAPAFLGLRRMSTRWGSCVPARGRIWLNVALVARPPAQLEYVLVHELAHLLDASHGPGFRRILDEQLPDWRERRAALDAG
jgi:predicted metal-dependent hydrolase